MAKKRTSRPQSSRPSSSQKILPGPNDELSSICEALGISPDELLQRFQSIIDTEEPTRPKRGKRRIDPKPQEWEAFDLLMNADPDDPWTLSRDVNQARKLDPRCAMIPITLAARASTIEEHVKLHREALELLGDRITLDNLHDLCGEEHPLEHPYGAPFVAAHRFLGEMEMSLHHYPQAIPHLKVLVATDQFPLDRSMDRSSLALCHIHQGRTAAAEECLGDPDELQLTHAGECMTRALLEFRLGGDIPSAHRWLGLAEDRNPYIVKLYLQDADASEFEDTDLLEEAHLYWAIAMPVWRETEGTMAWVRQHLQQTQKERKSSLSERKERAEQLVEELNEYPLGDDTWRVVIREDVHPQAEQSEECFVAYVTSSDGTNLMNVMMFQDRPKTEDLLQLIIETCEEQEDLPRPLEVLFEDKRLVRLAERGLGMCGMKARLTDPLPELDRLIESHLESLNEATSTPTDRLEDVGELPATDEPWLVGFGRIHAWVEVEGRLIRPWFGVVISPEGVRRFLQLITPSVTEADWEALLCAAMCHPLLGEPGVPQKLIFRNPEQQAAACEVWEALDIEPLQISSLEMDPDEPDPVWSFILEFSRSMEPESLLHQALSSIDGITETELQQFYTAACEYHRAAPWRLCGEHTPLILKGGDWPAGRVMCTMGEAGVTQGLSVFPSRKEFDAASRGGRTNSLVVLFDEPQLAAYSDLDLIEAHGWPVSSEQAYAVALLTHGPGSLELPSRSDIQMLTAALRMIPQLILKPQEPVIATDPMGRELSLACQLHVIHLPERRPTGSRTGSPKGRKKKR